MPTSSTVQGIANSILEVLLYNCEGYMASSPGPSHVVFSCLLCIEKMGGTWAWTRLNFTLAGLLFEQFPLSHSIAHACHLISLVVNSCLLLGAKYHYWLQVLLTTLSHLVKYPLMPNLSLHAPTMSSACGSLLLGLQFRGHIPLTNLSSSCGILVASCCIKKIWCFCCSCAIG